MSPFEGATISVAAVLALATTALAHDTDTALGIVVEPAPILPFAYALTAIPPGPHITSSSGLLEGQQSFRSAGTPVVAEVFVPNFDRQKRDWMAVDQRRPLIVFNEPFPRRRSIQDRRSEGVGVVIRLTGR